MKEILMILFVSMLTWSHAQVLVLPGDFPDPSVVKIGDSYWATATTSNWAPAFPLLHSKDLVHWELKSHVFMNLPSWADYYFWAPEISYEKNKVYVYYAAHKIDGNLCVAVASADSPEGPYADHGTLMCEKAGSIDAFPFRDNSGKLFLIWKEDGNSVKEPTPIWAMEMNEERTALKGEKFELFRNDTPWEGNLVEGVSMIRHGEYIYAFYAGAGCCGRECSYAMGVARAKDLRGPWEKYEKNPLFNGNEIWKCPGHGTPIEKDGRYYLLYHAYHAKSGVYAGRQGVLKEFKFTNDGWIALVNDTEQSIEPEKVTDNFSAKALSQEWQWSVFQPAKYKITKDKMELMANSDESGSFIARKTFTENYSSEVAVLRKTSTAAGGLAIVGDDKNMIILTVDKDKIFIVKLKDNKKEILHEKKIADSDRIILKATVQNGDQIVFSTSDGSGNFQQLNPQPISGTYLPPWDRAVRVALTAKGAGDKKVVFDDFKLEER
jgi:beta-xylosidase